MSRILTEAETLSAAQAQAIGRSMARRLTDRARSPLRHETWSYGECASQCENFLRLWLRPELRGTTEAERTESPPGIVPLALEPPPPPPAVRSTATIAWDGAPTVPGGTRDRRKYNWRMPRQRRGLYGLSDEALCLIIIANLEHDWTQEGWLGEGLLYRLATNELDTPLNAMGTWDAAARWLTMALLLSHPEQRPTWANRATGETPLHRIAGHWDSPSARHLWDLLFDRLSLGTLHGWPSLLRAAAAGNILGATVRDLFNGRTEALQADNRLEAVRNRYAGWPERLAQLEHLTGSTIRPE